MVRSVQNWRHTGATIREWLVHHKVVNSSLLGCQPVAHGCIRAFPRSEHHWVISDGKIKKDLEKSFYLYNRVIVAGATNKKLSPSDGHPFGYTHVDRGDPLQGSSKRSFHHVVLYSHHDYVSFVLTNCWAWIPSLYCGDLQLSANSYDLCFMTSCYDEGLIAAFFGLRQITGKLYDLRLLQNWPFHSLCWACNFMCPRWNHACFTFLVRLWIQSMHTTHQQTLWLVSVNDVQFPFFWWLFLWRHGPNNMSKMQTCSHSNCDDGEYVRIIDTEEELRDTSVTCCLTRRELQADRSTHLKVEQNLIFDFETQTWAHFESKTNMLVRILSISTSPAQFWGCLPSSSTSSTPYVSWTWRCRPRLGQGIYFVCDKWRSQGTCLEQLWHRSHVCCLDSQRIFINAIREWRPSKDRYDGQLEFPDQIIFILNHRHGSCLLPKISLREDGDDESSGSKQDGVPHDEASDGDKVLLTLKPTAIHLEIKEFSKSSS